MEKWIPPHHPYWDVMIGKPQEYWDWQKHQVHVGNYKHYEPIAPIGKGNFSKVISAKHVPTGKEYAVKVMTHNRTWKILAEIHILRLLKDAPNFLPIRDILKDDRTGNLAVVFDLQDKEDYKTLFLDLTDYDIRYYMYETFRTLEYAHQRGIFHRDIKPLNVLMTRDRKIKVIDWGHADFYFPNKQYTVRIASMYYKGPELLLNYTMYDYSTDIWASGCMFSAMIFNRFPMFKGKDFPSQLDAIAQVVGTLRIKAFADEFKEFVDASILEKIGNHPNVPFESFVDENNKHKAVPQAIDLLKKMLIVDYRKRITVKEAMEHPYFDIVRKTEGYS